MKLVADNMIHPFYVLEITVLLPVLGRHGFLIWIRDFNA